MDILRYTVDVAKALASSLSDPSRASFASSSQGRLGLLLQPLVDLIGNGTVPLDLRCVGMSAAARMIRQCD